MQKDGVGVISQVKYILVSMRIKHWVKNLLVFAGVVFSGKLLDLSVLFDVGSGFILFGLAASSIYLFNDIRDLKYDRTHPRKKNRPLAAGLLSVAVAYVSAVAIASAGLALALYLDPMFSAILMSYLVINMAYTLKIKEIVILDVMCIASGFVLRMLAGTVLAGVAPSDWLIICTISLSLFLGFSKRRQELILIGPRADGHRKVLADYSIDFIDQMIAVATACSVISYSLYTISPQTVARFGSRNLVFTVPFVIYGIYRYLFLMHQKKKGGDPTTDLISDLPLLINGLLWFVITFVFVYLKS